MSASQNVSAAHSPVSSSAPSPKPPAAVHHTGGMSTLVRLPTGAILYLFVSLRNYRNCFFCYFLTRLGFPHPAPFSRTSRLGVRDPLRAGSSWVRTRVLRASISPCARGTLPWRNRGRLTIDTTAKKLFSLQTFTKKTLIRVTREKGILVSNVEAFGV